MKSIKKHQNIRIVSAHNNNNNCQTTTPPPLPYSEKISKYHTGLSGEPHSTPPPHAHVQFTKTCQKPRIEKTHVFAFRFGADQIMFRKKSIWTVLDSAF